MTSPSELGGAIPEWQIPTSFQRIFLDRFSREAERVLVFFEDRNRFSIEELSLVLCDRAYLIQGEQQGA